MDDMRVHCADCDSTFLLTPDGMTQSAACPHCGGKRLERDQPSPTHSDGELRDMVDPSTGLDQGGNPLQEGIWATTDGGWQPFRRRDESYASVRLAEDFDFGGEGGFDFGGQRAPTDTVAVGRDGTVYALPGNLHHEEVADQYNLHDLGFPNGFSLGHRMNDGTTEWYQHNSGLKADQLANTLTQHFGEPVTVDPTLRPSTNEERWETEPRKPRRELDVLYGQPKPRSYGVPRDRDEGLIRGGSLSMEPYMPWTHLADEEIAPEEDDGLPPVKFEATPGQHGIHNGTVKWLRFADAHINGLSARTHGNEIFSRFGMRNSPEFGQPVTVAVHHDAHIPGIKETIEQSAEGFKPTPLMQDLGLGVRDGRYPPPPGIDPTKISKIGRYKLAGPAVAIPLAEGLAEAGTAAGAGEAAGAAGAGLAEAGGGVLNAIKGVGGGILGLAKSALGRAVPFAMGHALAGVGSHLLGIGGGGGGGQQQPLPGPRDPSALASVHTGDYEYPGSVPEVDVAHDYPEDQDQKQFKDDSDSSNLANPAMDDSGASGEDDIYGGFHKDSPALDRALTLLPLILHYYHSDESGANDPLVRELHNLLESENPGYLDRPHPHGEAIMQHFLNGLGNQQVTAAGYAPQQGFGVQPTTGPSASPAQPTQLQNQAPDQQQGRCPYCGGVTTADGSCPQCGAKIGPGGGATPQGTATQTSTPPGMAVGVPGITSRVAADHQGPITDEQKAAVAQLLIGEGRTHEIPNMLQSPWDYAREMAEVGHREDRPPNVDPNESQPTPPPAPQMMTPDMSGGAGAMPGQGIPPGVAHVAADGIAQKCPKCGSHTTALMNARGDCRCHACGNVWNDENIAPDNPAPQKIAAPDAPNVVALPAADQPARREVEHEQDSSHTWQDQDGEPLQTGREYEMHSRGYEIPDIVRIDAVKPDAITVTIIGQYSNQDGGGGMDYQHEVTKEESDIEGLTFVPSATQDDDAGSQNFTDYADDTEGSPRVNTEPGPYRSHITADALEDFQRTVRAMDDDPTQHGQREKAEETNSNGDFRVGDHWYDGADGDPLPDNVCPHCGSHDCYEEMSTPTRIAHECYRCAHVWETEDEPYETDYMAHTRNWILSGGDEGDDFWRNYDRVRQGVQTGSGRDIRSIAANDPRLQAIHARLEDNRMQREAGKKFTPREQREFIEEGGVARNADRLDLEGTHYKVREDWTGKADADSVPSEHLFMGV